MSRISYDSYRTPYYLSIIPVIQSSTVFEGINPSPKEKNKEIRRCGKKQK